METLLTQEWQDSPVFGGCNRWNFSLKTYSSWLENGPEMIESMYGCLLENGIFSTQAYGRKYRPSVSNFFGTVFDNPKKKRAGTLVKKEGFGWLDVSIAGYWLDLQTTFWLEIPADSYGMNLLGIPWNTVSQRSDFEPGTWRIRAFFMIRRCSNFNSTFTQHIMLKSGMRYV